MYPRAGRLRRTPRSGARRSRATTRSGSSASTPTSKRCCGTRRRSITPTSTSCSSRKRATSTCANASGEPSRLEKPFLHGSPEHADHRRAIAQEHDGEADFVTEVAFTYPMNAILEILGVPPTDYDYMLQLTQEAFGGGDPTTKREDVPATPEAMARQWKESLADFY